MELEALAVNAESGRWVFEGGGLLIEAWAVLLETEAVGGPEAKMERLGVANKDDGLGGSGMCEAEDGDVVREAEVGATEVEE